jgi:predicted RNA-binding Zn-ribbon protein involved in translation (DUF1610 family)
MDYPFAEVTRKAAHLSSEGHDVHQKFTCSSCGKRVRVRTPNFFLSQVVCSKCGKVTDVSRTGCNYEIARGNDVAARSA